MFKSRGRHRKARIRIGPLFALEAVFVMLAAKREMSAASAAQLAEMTADGTR